jgi:preprotein translocase subunit SecE
VVIALQTAIVNTAWSYIQGSRTELRRMVWPTRRETVQTTLMVVVVVLILAIFIWALDIVLAWAVQLLTGR